MKYLVSKYKHYLRYDKMKMLNIFDVTILPLDLTTESLNNISLQLQILDIYFSLVLAKIHLYST